MRIKKPFEFDPNKEYAPGERAIYRGMIIIANIWTKIDKRLAEKHSRIFQQRCVRCKIHREDCLGIGLKCDKYNRSDKKTIYWGLLRMDKNYKGVDTLEFKYNGTIAGVKKSSDE